jgi:modulator of FtsH protease HflC
MSPTLRHPIALGIAAILLLILLANTIVIVPETKQAVIVRFGQPERTLNRYRPGEAYGETGAGITVRIPFVDQVHWIDKQILSITMENQQVLSADQRRLEVDAYARYRITNPLRMYVAADTEDNLANQLRSILSSALRNELGRQPFTSLLSPERGQMMDNIETALNRVAHQYGAEIIDVRIKHADLPEGTPLESAYERMRTARTQEARSIEAQGYRQAQIIKADADAEAVATYARAFNRDPDFYDFYRAMQSYLASFTAEPQPGEPPRGRTSIILSPNNDYLRQFRSGGSAAGGR